METVLSRVFLSGFASPAIHCHTQYVNLMSDSYADWWLGQEDYRMSDKMEKNWCHSIKGTVKIMAHRLHMTIRIIHLPDHIHSQQYLLVSVLNYWN